MNKRLRYGLDVIKVALAYPIEDSKVLRKSKQFKMIKAEDFKYGVFSRKPIYIFSYEYLMKKFVKYDGDISEKQLIQILDVLEKYNSGMFFNFHSSYLHNMLKNGVETKFADRLHMLNRLKSSDSLMVYFISRGSNYRELWQKEKCDSVKGENNPGYQHGGKFSALSEHFVGYQGLNKECIQEKISSVCKKIKESNTDNPNAPAYYKHYMVKYGVSEEEAKHMAFERNSKSVASEAKYIEMYGEEEGVLKWKQRNIDWQAKLKAKSIEEIEEINKKKASGYKRSLLNAKEAILYYIRFYGDDVEFWKIGFTTQSISKRFSKTKLKSCGLDYEVIHQLKGDPFDIISKERDLLEKFHEHRKNIKHNGFKSTECFGENLIDYQEMLNAKTKGIFKINFREKMILINSIKRTVEDEVIQEKQIENDYWSDWE